jgi:dTDP-4-amino-4,6-dideoxygalactose transaminase
MIYVTKPYLPSKEKLIDYIDQIYKNEWLTNNGPLLKSYEEKLSALLDIPKLLFLNNGTIALQFAIKALDLKDEVITTPFSYVATTSSIVWENCTPVFVDIDEHTLNIDPKKIESAISSKTSGILATHCFGNACDIDAISNIAKKYNIKVIYDAAHCFGTSYKGKSIFNYGDVSTTSLHATKIIHSVEGGLIFSSDEVVFQKLHYMRNFGHDGPEKFFGLGINGKNSEFHAAVGLSLLDDYSQIMYNRKIQSLFYDELLKGLPLRKPVIDKNCEHNFSYYPVIFENEFTALKVKGVLEAQGIFPRRYFYPCLNNLPYVSYSDTPIADRISSSILCLPLFHDLTNEIQEGIVDLIKISLG